MDAGRAISNDGSHAESISHKPRGGAATYELGDQLIANRRWLVVLVALVAMALVTGCGSSSSDSSSSTAASGNGGSSSSGSSGSSSSGAASSTDVYNACIDAISGTPAEAAGKPGCQAAKDAFDQCSQQSSSLSGSAKTTALNVCQDAANKAVDALKAAG